MNDDEIGRLRDALSAAQAELRREVSWREDLRALVVKTESMRQADEKTLLDLAVAVRAHENAEYAYYFTDAAQTGKYSALNAARQRVQALIDLAPTEPGRLSPAAVHAALELEALRVVHAAAGAYLKMDAAAAAAQAGRPTQEVLELAVPLQRRLELALLGVEVVRRVGLAQAPSAAPDVGGLR